MRGFLMGAADVVPGVSGGTIALVLRIYERLVTSIRNGSLALGSLVRMDRPAAVTWLKRVDWKLLIPLLTGILLAVATLAHFLEVQLAERPVQLAGAFTGLVAGSAVVAWRLIDVDLRRIAVLAATAIITFVMLGLSEGTSEETVAQAADPSLLAFFLAGSIAICAMILPGISGSFLLVVMGMYGPVLAAVTSRSVGTIVVFVAGAIVGLAVFSQILHWALRRYHDTVMAALIGLMVGSIRVLWPWPDGVNSTALGAPEAPVFTVVLLAALGFGLVVLIDLASQRLAPEPEPVAMDDAEAAVPTGEPEVSD